MTYGIKEVEHNQASEKKEAEKLEASLEGSHAHHKGYIPLPDQIRPKPTDLCIAVPDGISANGAPVEAIGDNVKVEMTDDNYEQKPVQPWYDAAMRKQGWRWAPNKQIQLLNYVYLLLSQPNFNHN